MDTTKFRPPSSPVSKSFHLLFASRRIPVQFKGNLSRKQMPAFYRSGSCFVCPSQKHEAFGLVNVEAMGKRPARYCLQERRNSGNRSAWPQQTSRSGFQRAYRCCRANRKTLERFGARLSKQAREDALYRFSLAADRNEINEILRN